MEAESDVVYDFQKLRAADPRAHKQRQRRKRNNILSSRLCSPFRGILA